MKRNRLLNSPKNGKLFSSDQKAPSRRKPILLLALLAFAGISITSMVLATSTPDLTDTKSKSIALPGQTINGTEPTTENAVASSNIDLKPAIAPQVSQPKSIAKVEGNDNLIASESEQLERIHLKEDSVNSPAVDSSTISNTDELSDTSLDDNALVWKEVTVQPGDNLSLIFPRVGLSARDVYEVAQVGKPIKPLLNLKPGQTLRFGLVFDETKSPTLQQLELNFSPVKTFQLTKNDSGFETSTLIKETEKRQQSVIGEIETSLFGSGLKAGLSDKLIMELAHVFGWDIDFALDIRQGDSFKVIFEEQYLDGKKLKDGDILAAEFTNQGKTYRAVRFTDAEGNSHYFSPNGDSMRKTFTRTPVHFSRISSGFNPNRKHPILKISRPHRGVDYAAATGTPILATGDGKVDFVGRKGGYGRVIILSHGGKYTTLYAHMSKFKSGIKRGQRIKQGQTIGYVGMSGAATGPHLHYEFRIDGVHRNPLTVALPKALPLDKKYMAKFKSSSAPLLAKLDSMQIPALAAITQ
ncbi:MAG TPA: peptidase M23 [Methylophaga aminisulfidivorans]|uniref:Peptidase M23 n=2 Tax=root TaxID=1 RepID=A0A7C1W1J9_9GAMM|nr:peptidase M23 [Methylophaga sp.]HEC75224.1 peptidase M23 [Methylophaga aminisulfidivorans]